MKFWDKYGNDPYGKIVGDKKGETATLEFSEAQLILNKDEESVTLAGMFTDFGEIKRRKKSDENKIEPCLCWVTFYSKTYKISNWDFNQQKNIENDCEPSKSEIALYKYIRDNIDTLQPQGKHIKGMVSHASDSTLTFLPDNVLDTYGIEHFKVEEIDPSNDFISYDPSKTGGYKKKGSYGLTPEQKLAFFRKQLIEGLKPQESQKFDNDSLLDLIVKTRNELPEESTFIAYIDSLRSITG